MAKLNIGGAVHTIRPLKLIDIEAVAEHLDEINVAIRKSSDPDAPSETLAESMATTRHMLAVFARGIDGLTVDELASMANMEDRSGFWITLFEVQQEAGMISKGEALPAADGQDGSAQPESKPAG